MTSQHPPIAQYVRHGLTRQQLADLGDHICRCTTCVAALLRATEAHTQRLSDHYEKLAEHIPAEEKAIVDRLVRERMAPVLKELMGQ